MATVAVIKVNTLHNNDDNNVHYTWKKKDKDDNDNNSHWGYLVFQYRAPNVTAMRQHAQYSFFRSSMSHLFPVTARCLYFIRVPSVRLEAGRVVFSFPWALLTDNLRQGVLKVFISRAT